MFNIIKVQADILKGLVKQSKGFRFMWGEINSEEIAVTTDGFVVFVIPKKLWFINPVGYKPSETMKNLFDDARQTEVAYRTEIRENNEGCIVKYKNDKTHAWFSEKLLKQFGKDCEVFIISPIKPAFILNDDKVIGMLCPARVKE